MSKMYTCKRRDRGRGHSYLFIVPLVMLASRVNLMRINECTYRNFSPKINTITCGIYLNSVLFGPYNFTQAKCDSVFTFDEFEKLRWLQNLIIMSHENHIMGTYMYKVVSRLSYFKNDIFSPFSQQRK